MPRRCSRRRASRRVRDRRCVALPGVLETIAEALKGPFLLAITYAGADGTEAERRVAPHGVLLGMRRYLVARDEDRDRACGISGSTASARRGSSARASCASPASTSRPMPPAPSAPTRTRRNTARSSGASRPEAAPTARDFVFHPASTSKKRQMAASSSASRPRAGSRWSGTSTSGAIRSKCSPRGSAGDGRGPPSRRFEALP
jgi:hypothetical protein